MEGTQEKFFNLEGPCPENILNCEKIREEYKKEMENYKSQGFCGGCIERSVKNKYTTIILSLTIQK